MFSICPQYGYSTLTLTFHECCPDPDWCCFCWELVESTLVRLAANLIGFCEENSVTFWVVLVCSMTVMNVTPTPNEDLLYSMYLSCVTDKLRHGTQLLLLLLISSLYAAESNSLSPSLHNNCDDLQQYSHVPMPGISDQHVTWGYLPCHGQ